METTNGANYRFFARWAAFSYQNAIWVILLSIIIAGTSVVYTANNLGIHTDTTDMLSEEVPFRVNHKRYKEAFPQYEDALLLVLDAPTPEQAHAAAKQLNEYLQKDTEHFYEASYLSGDSFFEQNGLLYKDIAELEKITDRLAAAQPLIARLSENPALDTFASVLTEAVDEMISGRNLDLGAVFNGISTTLDTRMANMPRALSWQILLDGEQQADRYQEIILTRPKLDYTQLFAAEQPMNAIREAAKNLGITADSPTKLRITGEAALAFDELHSAMRGAQDAGMLALVLVIVVLLIALRTIGAIMTVLFSLALGLLLTAAFATFAVGHLNLISIAFAVLYIGLGIDYAIHFLLRHEEVQRTTGLSVTETLPKASGDIGHALMLCAVTTAIGFYAFMPTTYDGVAELGLISGSGMMISLLVTLTVVPALQRFFPMRTIKPLISMKPIHQALEWPGHSRKTVYTLTFFIVLLSLIALPQVRFDYNLLNLNDPHVESVETFRDLLENADNSPWHIVALEDDQTETEQLVHQLTALPEVDKVVTLLDMVPDNQDEKILLIEEMAMTLGPITFMPIVQKDMDVDAQRTALQELRQALGRLINEQPAHAAIETARALYRSLSGLLMRLDQAGTHAAQAQLLSATAHDLLHLLPKSIHRLQAALQAQPFDRQDMPESVRMHWLSDDHIFRVAIYPNENINDNDALTRFVRAVQQITPGATGVPVISLEAGEAVVDAFIHAFSLALIGVIVALLVLLRSVRSTMLVMVPLLLGALFTVATAVLFDVSFNFANVIALPLILGIGIDCSVHMVHRSGSTGENYENLLHTSTARAIFYSALTTMTGFGSMIFSQHQGTASMGLLLLIGVILTLACVLIILPVLLQSSGNKKVPVA
ncbi:MAG: MMPL family transporter [Nitrosomonas sp.]|nr:MMPL family transporter [Nitrosomonas sp.]MCW5607706.1 MMPL family transporter [Nitrosomonas sp.]